MNKNIIYSSKTNERFMMLLTTMLYSQRVQGKNFTSEDLEACIKEAEIIFATIKEINKTINE